MQKIPTLYRRDFNTHLVTTDVNAACEWVLAGEGTPTRKYDGTAMNLDDSGAWWARREVKPRAKFPIGFWFVEKDILTGKTFGWEPVAASPFAKFHADALEHSNRTEWQAGTYELCGPKVNGNPEGFSYHVLIRHADAAQFGDRDGLSPEMKVRTAWELGWEGIVWHHRDGRMAKLKARDYGLR